MSIQHTQLNIQGMTCQSCANRIEKVLQKKDFIQSAHVNFASETASISFDNQQTNIPELIKLIEKTGFQATLPTSLQIEHINQGTQYRLYLLLLLASPFLLGMFGMLFGTHYLMPAIWLQVGIATIVQTYFAMPFYRGAINSLSNGSANMDVLVALGTLSIYIYSVFFGFFQHQQQHIYFEASVMVITFVSLGKFLEAKTKRGSLNSLNTLLSLTPKEVSVFRQQQWLSIPLAQVNIGDTLRCLEGERIGADGIILKGEGWANESHLTGESQPVYKTIGSQVLAGSIFSGSIEYRADSLGKETLLGDMATALAEAQGTQAPIARIADKVSAIFVPIVLVIAVLTFLITYWLNASIHQATIHAVAVLVVACPCALGLATPAAIMAGMGLAVKQGIWFKNAEALEQTGHIDTIVLDKTGTLTKGQPNIVATWKTENYSTEQLYQIAASIEQHATHPLARAIVQAAQQHNIELLNAENLQTIAGEGITAEIKSIGQIKIGKPSFCHFRLPENIQQENPLWQISTLVAVSIDNQPIGAFALADELKTDSTQTIQQLQQQGLQIYILSGDNQATVEYIASQLNLSPNHAYANQSPRQKTEFIQQLKQQGRTVAMVGDGINDSAALTAAHIGFSVYGSTDIAQQSSNVILVQPSIKHLAQALLIANATLRTIKQNLFFAFIYNLLGIPLAACGLLTPVLAGGMMAMSSISVLLNALKLTRLKLRAIN